MKQEKPIHTETDKLDPAMYASLFEHLGAGVCWNEIIYDEGKAVDYRILALNPALCELLGVERERTAGRRASEVHGEIPPLLLETFAEVAETGRQQRIETWVPLAGKHLELHITCPKFGYVSIVSRDISERKAREHEREAALDREKRERKALDLMLEGARLVLSTEELEPLSETFFAYARQLTGAEHGYVAALSRDRTQYTLLSGNSQDVIPQIGELKHAYETQKTVIDNDPGSYGKEPLLDAHAEYRNLMLIPLKTDRTVYGILCLADKSEPFSEEDRLVCEGICNLLAMGFRSRHRSELLRESEARYEAFLNNHPDSMFIKDDQHRYLMVNDSYLAIYGQQREDVLQKTDYQMFSSEIAAKHFASDNEVLGTGEPIEFEDSWGERAYQIIKFPIPKAGDGLLMGGFIHDITAQKQSQRELRLIQQRLRSQVSILQSPQHDTAKFFQAAVEEAAALSGSLLGYLYLCDEKGESLSLKASSGNLQLPAHFRISGNPLLDQLIREQKPLRPENPAGLTGTDTEEAPRNWMLLPAVDGNRTVMVCAVAGKSGSYTQNDMVQLTLLLQSVWREARHRRATEELHRIEWMLSPEKQREELQIPDYPELPGFEAGGKIAQWIEPDMLRSIASEYLELLGSSTAIFDTEGRAALHLQASPWCSLMDFASRSLSRQSGCGGDWLCGQAMRACARRAMEHEQPFTRDCSCGLTHFAVPVTVRGETVGAIVTGYGDPPGNQEHLSRLADTYQVDLRQLTRTAEEHAARPPYIIDMAKRRITDAARLIGLLIEQQVDADERETLADQLRQAQKMEAVGQLAGGVAHDFNNILQGIIGYSQLMLETCPKEMTERVFVQEILKGGERAATLTRQLLAFSRRQVMRPKNISLNTTVDNILKMLGRIIGEHIKLEWLPGRHLGLINGDEGMIEQILMNLCINAKDAMPDGGTLTIETQNTRIDSAYCATHSWASPGRYVLLSVTDTGTGMPPDELERIFEPFYTTKREGHGTGLGLSTVYGIVKQHEGMIIAYSEPEKGSTFKVYFPLSESAATEVGTLISSAVSGGTGTILLAEDDPTVRSLVEHVLRKAGYTVYSAVDGEEAILLFKEHREEISLLILDVIMPNMGGHAAYEKIQVIRAGIPALFTSGYSQNAVHTNFVLHEGLRLLQKPYSPNELLKNVTEILKASS